MCDEADVIFLIFFHFLSVANFFHEFVDTVFSQFVVEVVFIFKVPYHEIWFVGSIFCDY